MKTPLLPICSLLCALCTAASAESGRDVSTKRPQCEDVGRAVGASLPAAAASPVFGGGLALPGATFLPHAFDTLWHGYGPVTVQDDGEATANDSSVAKVRFRMAIGSGDPPPAFDGTATFTADDSGSLRAEWRLVATADADLNETFVGGDVPFSRFGGGKVLLDGRDFPLPTAVTKEKHLFRGTVTNLALIDRDGEERLCIALDAPTRILLQDDRHWKTDDLSIRFFLAYGPVKAGAEYALGATFTTPADGPLALVPPRTVRLVAGPEWTTLKYDPWIEPGSALDFTDVIPHHSPAGKFGRVVAVGDHFEFEGLPGVPQRFYGVNLCGTANLPESKEEADRFAANLARIGYNAVRIHHHEKWLVSKDGKLPEGAGGARGLAPEGAGGARGEDSPRPLSFSDTALDPGQMDKLDRLIASCVEHGLYITTDLYVSRAHVVPWRALGIDRDGAVKPDAYKLLVAFHEPAFSNLCAWARNFLGHVNPYTGRSLANEPALCALALVNEGNLGNYGMAALRDTPGVAAAWGKPLPNDLNDPAFASFLAERETILFERLKTFVRDECGCAAPLSSISAWYNPIQYQLTRTHFDYVDNHFYVDHPQFLGVPWRLPSRCPNVNPFLSTAKGAQKAEWYRLMDKPFCVTEFNYSGPGRFRGVGGVALGTLASLQDWSGLWRFAWSHSRDGIVKPGRQLGYFDVAGDPLALAAERAGLCLFLRRDLEPLAEERPAIFDEATLRNPEKGAVDFPGPDQPLALGWTARVGTRVVKGAAEAENAFDGNRVQSDAINNRVSISSSGSMLLDTPRTAGGFAEGGIHQVGPLKFEITASSVSRSFDSSKPVATTPAAATVWASSLDGEPIASSRHLLVTHLTDVQNSRMEYADADLKTLINWGGLPHIMRNGTARIELRLSALCAKDNAAHAANEGGASRQMTKDNNSVIAGAAGSVIAAKGRTSLPLEERPVIDGGGGAATVFRLSSSGKRLGEVPATWDPDTGRLSFTARTDWDPAAATYLYEIVRE